MNKQGIAILSSTVLLVSPIITQLTLIPTHPTPAYASEAPEGEKPEEGPYDTMETGYDNRDTKAMLKGHGVYLNPNASFDFEKANDPEKDGVKKYYKDIEKLLDYYDDLKESGVWEKDNEVNSKGKGNGSDGESGEGSSSGSQDFGGKVSNSVDKAGWNKKWGPWQVQATGAWHGTHPGVGKGAPYNCTWYVGDRLMQTGMKENPPGVWLSNGGNWAGELKAAGYYTTKDKPYAGMIASSYADDRAPGFAGLTHVMFVEAVNPDGSIMISEGNWYPNSMQGTKGGKPAPNGKLMGTVTRIERDNYIRNNWLFADPRKKA